MTFITEIYSITKVQTKVAPVQHTIITFFMLVKLFGRKQNPYDLHINLPCDLIIADWHIDHLYKLRLL